MEKHGSPTLFGEWLQQRRKILDLTQAELAQRAGCSVFALRKIESGERRPSKQLAELLGRALEIPPEERSTFIRVARGELNLERLTGAPSNPAAAPGPLRRPPLMRLPAASTPLIGRDAELAALKELFDRAECRLVTLTGMGGIGKTRLAVEFAAAQEASFPGGIAYVSLAALNTGELIMPAIADAIGYTFSGPGDPREQLLTSLADLAQRPFLLILDNFEHLLVPFSQEISQTGGTDLVSVLLQRVPKLKILTTSRERLNLYGEWTFELPGLPVPPANAAERIEDYSAAALFIQSARRVRAGFSLDEEETRWLRQICTMLDGIPLAIELAAAWVEVLSCREIAEEIRSNLDFLSTSMRDMPARHRSLRATFDHSWELLSEQERGVLARLAVFHGGFRRESAGKVAGASLPLLGSLFSKSLISRSEAGRYDLHEVIRQYALLHLESDPANEETRRRHSAYYLSFAREHERALKSARQQAAHRELSEEIDNVREAWAWSMEHGRLASPAAAARSLAWYFEVGGLLHEGIELLEDLVKALRPGVHDPAMRKALGQALAQQSLLFFRKGDFGRAQTNLEESLSLLRPLSDPAALIDPLIYLAVILHLNGDLDRSQALLEEGLAYSQAEGEEWFEAFFLDNLGYIASLRNRPAEGYELMQDALAIWRKLGDPHSIAMGINFTTPTLIRLGRYIEAEAALQESIALSAQTGNRWGMGTAYRFLGAVKLAEGEYSAAQLHLRNSLEIFGDYFAGWDIARTLAYLGEAILKGGDPEGAHRAYAGAFQMALATRAMPIALEALTGLARVLLQTGNAGEALELAVHVLGEPATTEEVREQAAELVVRAEAQLGAAQAGKVRKRAKGDSLESLAGRINSSLPRA
ncbi:MAG: ATP-binding protein [Bacteroidota bacterium]